MSGIRLSRAYLPGMVGHKQGWVLFLSSKSALNIKEKSSLSIEETAAAFVRENRPNSILRRAASVEEVANLVVHAASLQPSVHHRRHAPGRWAPG